MSFHAHILKRFFNHPSRYGSAYLTAVKLTHRLVNKNQHGDFGIVRGRKAAEGGNILALTACKLLRSARLARNSVTRNIGVFARAA